MPFNGTVAATANRFEQMCAAVNLAVAFLDLIDKTKPAELERDPAVFSRRNPQNSSNLTTKLILNVFYSTSVLFILLNLASSIAMVLY